ncbi:hypothetical protein CU048_13775 [Beijerinckiaceae bacterium]|nr:hypothetical protein CU048_13775 [Beijerinckiaceae bacterium]
MDTIRPVVERTGPARKAMRWNANRKDALRPPTPPRDDLVGELQRREIRDHIKGLPIGERLVFALEHPLAVLAMPAALSGLPEDQYQRVRDAFIAEKFGPEIAEIEVLDSDLEIVGAAYDLALGTLRDASGLSEPAFTSLVDKFVREIDGV